jgi:ATP-dependent RNA helicase RhlE
MNLDHVSDTPHPNPSPADPASAGFDGLGLTRSLRDAVRAAGYDQPTPIQHAAIPHVLAGRDLVGCAQTGTGKTAAFALPILHRLLAAPAPARPTIRVLVLAPTRELAAQIGESFGKYATGSHLGHLVVFGGVKREPHVRALRRPPTILVATPGRLLDLMSTRDVSLANVEYLVLDEADRMLDMGFIHDVRRIVAAVPRERQTLLFSATMPREIEQLARTILRRPEHVAVDPISSTCEPIAQSVYFVEQRQKLALLVKVLRRPEVERVLVFTRTKHGANRVASGLEGNSIGAAAIHGNKSQSARERALAGFRSGAMPVIVATDLASRGLDVKGISHVINYDLPNEPEVYVHRVGRTGRAGASGVALSFCSHEERPYLASIERLTGADIRRQTHDVPAGPSPTTSGPTRPVGRPAPSTAGRGRPLRSGRRRAGVRGR